MRVFLKTFDRISAAENLFAAWDAFRSDKANKPDVMAFGLHVEEQLFQLHRDLRRKTYRHGAYTSFTIHDPKQRHIHKATVRDRILHHALYAVLNPIFEPTFIPTSFSCRVGKGTHKGVQAVARMVRRVTHNGTRPGFVLKCDVRKFFFRIDRTILFSMLAKKMQDPDTLWLLGEVINGLPSLDPDGAADKGLPIGNLTSQLFANVYLNAFDQFVKGELKVKHYARYTDDFVIIAEDAAYLEGLLPRIRSFLETELALQLHPQKTTIRKLGQGVDFLGYVIFPHHTVLRTRTKERMFRKLRQKSREYHAGEIDREKLEQSLQSYLGVLSHANAYRLSQDLENQFRL